MTLTGSSDTDDIMISYLDISTIAYCIRSLNKYYYEYTNDIVQITNCKMYPVTKYLFETEGFLEKQFDNIICGKSIRNHKQKSKKMILRMCAKYHLNIDIIKWLRNTQKCPMSHKLFYHICEYESADTLNWLKSTGHIAHEYDRDFNICKCSEHIAKNKNIDTFKWIYNRNMYCIRKYACHKNFHCCGRYLVEHNNIGAINIIVDDNPQIVGYIIECAVGLNNMDIVSMLLEKGFCTTSSKIYEMIAKTGNRIILEKILSGGIKINEKSCNNYYHKNYSMATAYAAERGDIEMIEILLKNGFPKHDTTFIHATIYCCKNNDTYLLKYLIENKFKMCGDAYTKAAEHRNLYVLNWLLKNNFPKSVDQLMRIIQFGDTEIISWMVSNEFLKSRGSYYLGKYFTYASDVVRGALKNRNANFLRWLSENNIPYDKENIFRYVMDIYCDKYLDEDARNIIKWFAENKCDIDDRLPYYIIRIGNLDLLDYMINKNISINSDIIRYAIDIRRFDMAKHLIQKKIKCDNDTSISIALSQNKDLILVAHENKVPMSYYNYICAIEKEDVEYIKWMIKNGFPKNCTDVVSKAIEKGNIKIIKLLMKNNFMCTKKDYNTYWRIKNALLDNNSN